MEPVVGKHILGLPTGYWVSRQQVPESSCRYVVLVDEIGGMYRDRINHTSWTKVKAIVIVNIYSVLTKCQILW